MGSASDSDFRPPDSTSQDGELPLPDSDGEGGCLSGCCLAQLVEDQRPVLEEADTDQVEDQFSGHNEHDMMNGYEDSHQVSSQFQNYYNYHSIDDDGSELAPAASRTSADEAVINRTTSEETVMSRTIADEAEISRATSEEAVMSRTIADEAVMSRITADVAVMSRTSADEAEMSRTIAEEVEMSRTSADEAEMSRTIAEEV